MRTETEIKEEIRLGEDSSRQFKVKLNNPTHVALEMCAMSKSSGGVINAQLGLDEMVTSAEINEIDLAKFYTFFK